ncbi:glycoside hydrolase family 16 protein [Pseudonocardia nematodicida]|uniref:Glycoside hydrolase family 16 protein n=1 Tax=Pseudonocardia nematodicida TaxID=1206997 RepID=A0ABV1KKT1_9PSEU
MDQQEPDRTGRHRADSGSEEPRRRRWPMVLGALLSVGALVAVVTVAANVDLLGSSREDTPVPVIEPAEPEPGGVRDQERPDDVGALGAGDRSDTEAAVRHGWEMVGHDEFDGTELDLTKWAPYTGDTTGGIGRHRAENLIVRDGELRLTSRGLDSAGLHWRGGQQHGRWEIRAKTNPGTGYGHVALLWPVAEDWPVGGELNFMEIPRGDRAETHTIVHYDTDNSQVGRTITGDFTEWHTYAVEWLDDRVVFYIDGEEVFRTMDPAAIPPRPMHLAMQTDIGPYGNDWIPPLDATSPDEIEFQVDWVRIYAP